MIVEFMQIFNLVSHVDFQKYLLTQHDLGKLAICLRDWDYQCVGDSATKFQHSYRGVSDSPGGGYASFDVNTTAQVTSYRIGNYIDAAIGYIVFTDIEMWRLTING